MEGGGGGNGGETGFAEVVDDEEIIELAVRMEQFYGALEGRSLDTLDTFQDQRLRAFFSTRSRVRRLLRGSGGECRSDSQHFRRSAAEIIFVRGFEFPDPDTARVDVILKGRHMRALRFWWLEIHRIDTWRMTSRGWVVSPDRL